MNFPKIICVIIVLVAIVALLYPTVDAAIPKEINGSPFSFELGSEPIDIKLNETTLDLDLSMPSATFGSTLPQDFKDVRVDVYLGSGADKVRAGTYDFGVIPSMSKVTKEFTSGDVNVLFLLGFVPELSTGESGQIDLPISVDIRFKYMEWQDYNLIDLGLGIKVTGTVAGGTVSPPVVEGNKSTVTVTADEGMVREAIEAIKEELGGDARIEFDNGSGQKASVEAIVSGNKLTVVADGGNDTLYGYIDKMVQDTGMISFTYDGHDYSVDGDYAKIILDTLKAYYPEGA